MQSLNLVKMFYVLAQLQICACPRSRNKARQRARKNDVGENIAETGSETKLGQGSHGNQSAKTGKSSFGGKDFAENFRNCYNKTTDKKGQGATKLGRVKKLNKATPNDSSTNNTKITELQKGLSDYLNRRIAKQDGGEGINNPDIYSETGNSSRIGNFVNADDTQNQALANYKNLTTFFCCFLKFNLKLNVSTLEKLFYEFENSIDAKLFISYELVFKLANAKEIYEELLGLANQFQVEVVSNKKLERYLKISQVYLSIIEYPKTKELVAEMAKTK